VSDVRGRLESDPFSIVVAKSGVVFISRGGRVIMQLGGRRAAALLDSLETTDDEQQVLARVTGHYKH
jgi:hypothetical protein